MKKITFLFLTLTLGFIGIAQTKSEKLDSIIEKLDFVEKQKKILIYYSIEPLKLEAEGQDSLQLVDLENRLTDAYIHSKIKSTLSESISNEDVDNLYNFVQTSTFEKYFSTGGFYNLASYSLSDEFKEMRSILESIDEKIEAERSMEYFTPIPVDREDGFYATKNYSGIPEKSVELVNDPALTKNDIEEISFEKNYLGNHMLNIKFTKEGAKIFYELTKINIGKPIAIVIDKFIISLPIVQEPIPGGVASISGNFTKKELQEFKDRLTK